MDGMHTKEHRTLNEGAELSSAENRIESSGAERGAGTVPQITSLLYCSHTRRVLCPSLVPVSVVVGGWLVCALRIGGTHFVQ